MLEGAQTQPITCIVCGKPATMSWYLAAGTRAYYVIEIECPDHVWLASDVAENSTK